MLRTFSLEQTALLISVSDFHSYMVVSSNSAFAPLKGFTICLMWSSIQPA